MTCSDLTAPFHGVVMPEQHRIALPAGETTLYAEHRSSVDGAVYEVAELSFRCGAADAAGKSLTLSTPTSSVSYEMGGYAGRNVLDLHVDTAGTYHIACEAPSQFVLASYVRGSFSSTRPTGFAFDVRLERASGHAPSPA